MVNVMTATFTCFTHIYTPVAKTTIVSEEQAVLHEMKTGLPYRAQGHLSTMTAGGAKNGEASNCSNQQARAAQDTPLQKTC